MGGGSDTGKEVPSLALPNNTKMMSYLFNKLVSRHICSAGSVAFISHLLISIWDSRKDSKGYILVDKLEKESQDYMENMPTAS